jgi:hypothetical protein
MGDSKLALSLETLVDNSARQLGTFQVGVNKILWGSGNTQPKQTVKYIPAVSGSSATTSSLSYTSTIPPPTPKPGNLVESGLFNALDALNQVDLCNVITYVTDTINIKKGPRPAKASWNATQTALYGLQGEAALVQGYIDKYVAYPNVFIGSYLGTGPNAVPQNQTNSPTGSGTDAQKYNMYFLMQAIKDTFSLSSNSSASLFTPEDRTLLTTVPGIGGNLNIIDDFLGTINKYSDYRQISNANLQALQNKITTIRSVCVTIQNLDFKSGLALAGNFLGVDIRNQIQQLSKFLDPTKIIPTLRQINAVIRAFIRIANQVLGVLRLGQYLIKLALLFYKIFKFITKFFTALPIPQMFSTVGVQIALQNASDTAKSELNGVSRLLKAVNALLAVVVTFIRYLLTNANEILVRLNSLLLTLEACEAMKGVAGQSSDILLELQQTRTELVTLKEQLAAYIIKHDSKIDPNTAMFGAYDIRIVDEEVTDRSIQNKRRRGIALNQDGQIVAQSDLTFATDSAIIIAEVKQKLVSLKLVQPNLVSGTSNNAVADATNLGVISESLNYLDNNDVIQDDLNITATQTDLPDNMDETKGLGLNAFINNLSGGRKLRKRVRAAMKTQADNARVQIAKEKTAANESLRGG